MPTAKVKPFTAKDIARILSDVLLDSQVHLVAINLAARLQLGRGWPRFDFVT